MNMLILLASLIGADPGALQCRPRGPLLECREAVTELRCLVSPAGAVCEYPEPPVWQRPQGERRT